MLLYYLKKTFHSFIALPLFQSSFTFTYKLLNNTTLQVFLKINNVQGLFVV